MLRQVWQFIYLLKSLVWRCQFVRPCTKSSIKVPRLNAFWRGGCAGMWQAFSSRNCRWFEVLISRLPWRSCKIVLCGMSMMSTKVHGFGVLSEIYESRKTQKIRKAHLTSHAVQRYSIHHFWGSWHPVELATKVIGLSFQTLALNVSIEQPGRHLCGAEFNRIQRWQHCFTLSHISCSKKLTSAVFSTKNYPWPSVVCLCTSAILCLPSNAPLSMLGTCSWCSICKSSLWGKKMFRTRGIEKLMYMAQAECFNFRMYIKVRSHSSAWRSDHKTSGCPGNSQSDLASWQMCLQDGEFAGCFADEQRDEVCCHLCVHFM